MTMELLIIGIVICAVVVQIYNIQKRRKLEREKEILEQVLAEEKEQYLELSEANKSLRYANHDLQKYMNVVREIVNDKGDGKLTGDDVMNRILRQKETETEKKGIRFTSTKNGRFSPRLTNAEIIRLLTNLLDNAIEAAEKCEQEPFVSVCIGVQETDGCEGIGVQETDDCGDSGAQELENRVHIEIHNSKNPEEKPLEKDMATSKSDKEHHGYGMRIIREIVERYEGHLEVEDRGDVFVVVVVV